MVLRSGKTAIDVWAARAGRRAQIRFSDSGDEPVLEADQQVPPSGFVVEPEVTVDRGPKQDVAAADLGIPDGLQEKKDMPAMFVEPASCHRPTTIPEITGTLIPKTSIM